LHTAWLAAFFNGLDPEASIDLPDPPAALRWRSAPRDVTGCQGLALVSDFINRGLLGALI
jgi:hypothetical protein